MKRDARNHTTKAWKLGLLTLLLTALAPSMSFAQAVSARLVGSVQDSSKSRVVAATVIAHAVATGIDTKAVTDSSGEYNFANILPGQYLLTASAEGFQTIEVRDVVLQIGDAKKLDITLSPKSVTQTVEVVETVPTIDTESTKVGAVVDSHQAQDLPLADRDAMKLFFLQAGTNPLDDLVPSGSQQQTGGVDGLPPGTSGIQVEGIFAQNSSFDYAPSHPSFPVPSEAVGEYRVSTAGNGSNDGASSGAQVKVLIKSGTNSFHGSAYDFLRNTILNGKSYFSTVNPPLHKNQYGYAIGGPIFKNKTFFFSTTEWQRQTQNDSEEATVYTSNVRQGLFLFNNAGKNSTSLVNPTTGVPIIPASQIGTINLTTVDSTKQGFDTAYWPGYLAKTPLPNAWDVGDGLNTAGYRYLSPDQDNYYVSALKIDHALTAKNALSLSLSQANENAPAYKYYTGTISEGYTEFRRGLSLRLVTSISPSLTNEVSLGGSLRHAFRANTTTYCENPTGNITLNVGTLCDSRDAQNNPAVTEGGQDTATKVYKKHTIEAGFEYWHETLNRQTGLKYPAINTSNSFNPANVPALAGLNSTDQTNAKSALKDVTGYVGSISQNFYLQPNGQDTQYGVLQEELRKNEWGLSAGDSWRLRRNVTVNVGLRWDILPIVTNRNPVVYPSGGLKGAQGIQGPTGAPTSWSIAANNGADVYSTDWHSFAPSVGVIWDPFGDGKSAVRASYHLSNVRSAIVTGDFSIANQGLSNSVTLQPATPGVRLSQLNQVLPITVPTALQTQGNIRQGSAYVAAPNLSTPYVQEWTFGLDREIFHDWKVSATYVGNHSVGLWDGKDLNQVEIRANGFLSAFLVAQQNLAANGKPTVGASLGSLQSLFAELPSTQYTAITLGQAATVANYLDTTAVSGVVGGYLTNVGLPATFFRYNPQFKDVYVVGNYGQTTWNGLKLEVVHRERHGIYLQANYTFSKGFTDAAAEAQDNQQQFTTSFRDNANHALDRQLSPLDATHVILANGLYELPFGRGKLFLGKSNSIVDNIIGGWHLNGIFDFTTGRPVSVTTGYNLLNQSTASVPNFDHSFHNLSHATKNLATSSATFTSASVISAAFSTPAAGQFGNFTEQNIHGLWYTNLDAGLYKSFGIRVWGEEAQIQLRGDYYNVLNHTNFVTPSITTTSGTIGNVTKSDPGRIGQLSAKFTF